MNEEIKYYYPIEKEIVPEGYEIEYVEVPDRIYVIICKSLMSLIFTLTTIAGLQTYFGKDLLITIIDAFGLTLYFLLKLCYYKAINTSPGIVNNYVPIASSDELNSAIERALGGIAKECKTCDMNYRIRWCSKCERFRPPRSYHCKKCGACIEKRDHHCPWISNCVGKNNMKFFYQFLFYAACALLVGSCINGLSIYHTLKSYNNKEVGIVFHWSIITVILPAAIATAIGLALFVGMTVLFVNHTMNIKRNETSMESIERSRLIMLNNNNEQLIRENIPSYDRGFLNNFKEIMGPNLIDWFFPISHKNYE